MLIRTMLQQMIETESNKFKQKKKKMYWLTLLKNPEIAQTFHMGGSESLNNAIRNLPHLSPPFWFALFYVGVNLRQMRTCDCNRAYNSSRLPSVSEGHLLPPWTNHCVFADWDQRLWEVSLSEVHDSSASCGRGNRVLDWEKGNSGQVTTDIKYHEAARYQRKSIGFELEELKLNSNSIISLLWKSRQSISPLSALVSSFVKHVDWAWDSNL